MKYTTFVSGTSQSGEFIQFRIAGVAKPATVTTRAAKRNITARLKAEAVSFDSSGKGRHIRKVVAV